MLFAFDFLSGLNRRGARTDDPAALARIRRLLAELDSESDARLHERTDELRRRVNDADFAAEAVSLITESIRRTHSLGAYDVQLRAGLALADGALVEMATGEGKTLAALLPAFCFALRGRGAHVATVNAYLAERDAAFAQPVFARLGLKVGLLRERDQPAAKRAAYACDVTYGIGTEFGFDYLRDQLAIRAAGRTEPRFHEILLRRFPPKPALLQRGHAFAVIDEADSVLLDEARSPLIISTGERRPNATPEVYRLAEAVAADMQAHEHFTRAAQTHRLTLTPAGERLAFARLTDAALQQLRRVWPQYIEQALHVRHQLRRDVHYVVAEGRVMIVDEFTGRLCPDRTWREGLHQAAETHAGVTITEENFSEATISRPTYFRLYERVCGLTGTAAEAAAELRATYELRTVIVQPNRPCQRTVLPDRVFATRAAKHAAVAREVAARHATGQPILIGTRTIENSEALVEELVPLGVPLRVLNAKQDAEEAAIIEQAGEPGAITIATNMAGRGAHIPVPEESQRAGGLHVIGLERHESARIDRQLIGRAARQGQPGSAQFFLSLEDDLLARHAPALAARLALHADASGELPPKCARYFLRAQRRVEALDHAQRRALAAHHRWLDELKQAI
jgi:preprotein translocase subunit SecA